MYEFAEEARNEFHIGNRTFYKAELWFYYLLALQFRSFVYIVDKDF